jgi:hypothetical protein
MDGISSIGHRATGGNTAKSSKYTLENHAKNNRKQPKIHRKHAKLIKRQAEIPYRESLIVISIGAAAW